MEGYTGSPDSVNSLGLVPSEPLRPPSELTSPPKPLTSPPPATEPQKPRTVSIASKTCEDCRGCVVSMERYETCPCASYMRACAPVMRLRAFHVRGNACGTSATVYCVRCRAYTYAHVRASYRAFLHPPLHPIPFTLFPIAPFPYGFSLCPPYTCARACYFVCLMDLLQNPTFLVGL